MSGGQREESRGLLAGSWRVVVPVPPGNRVWERLAGSSDVSALGGMWAGVAGRGNQVFGPCSCLERWDRLGRGNKELRNKPITATPGGGMGWGLQSHFLPAQAPPGDKPPWHTLLPVSSTHGAKGSKRPRSPTARSAVPLPQQQDILGHRV